MGDSWWRDPLGALVDGRRVIVAGGPAAFWTPMVATLRDLGATDVLVVATEGAGAGPQPEARSVIVEPDGAVGDTMARIRAAVRALAEPPQHVVDAIEDFDADRRAVTFGSFLTETPSIGGRPLVAHRRPEWVALEDKTQVDALLDEAGVVHAPSVVVPIATAVSRWRQFDHGAGAVWTADARDGYHGGGHGTRWVTDADEADAATAALSTHCDLVRLMPFLDGIATSVHGLVLPDGVVALRPVELLTLRRGHELRYSGCATFWDPPGAIRVEMRDAARRVGELLRRTVDFRGAFTLDGVATTDGFRPTELNPRFGAGLGVITSGLPGLPLHLVLDLVVAGIELPISAAALEAELVELADTHRAGGSWQLGVEAPVTVDGRPACYGDGEWRWAEPEEPAHGTVVAAQGFARVTFEAAHTPVGPSVGQRAVDFWRFADAELGTDVGPLLAPGERVRSSGPPPTSTRP
jgi:hypothetical protein